MHSRGPSGSLDQCSTVQWLLQVRLQIISFWAKDGVRQSQSLQSYKAYRCVAFTIKDCSHTLITQVNFIA